MCRLLDISPVDLNIYFQCQMMQTLFSHSSSFWMFDVLLWCEWSWALHKFPSFISLGNICPLTISPNLGSAIYLHKSLRLFSPLPHAWAVSVKFCKTSCVIMLSKSKKYHGSNCLYKILHPSICLAVFEWTDLGRNVFYIETLNLVYSIAWLLRVKVEICQIWHTISPPAANTLYLIPWNSCDPCISPMQNIITFRFVLVIYDEGYFRFLNDVWNHLEDSQPKPALKWFCCHISCSSVGSISILFTADSFYTDIKYNIIFI